MMKSAWCIIFTVMMVKIHQAISILPLDIEQKRHPSRDGKEEEELLQWSVSAEY